MIIRVQIGKSLLRDLIQRLSASGLTVHFASLASNNSVQAFVRQPGALSVRFESASVLIGGHEAVVVDTESGAFVRCAECL